ncbi:MAG: hypothetical protein RI957_808 [Verrucomicrobiota bacterium]|jgi:hypothetical protein
MKYQCPSCDQDVEVGRNCPRCARPPRKRAREKKSWEQDRSADGLDLPDDDFDYDDFIAREWGSTPQQKIGIAWYWYLVALLLLIAMLFGIFR